MTNTYDPLAVVSDTLNGTFNPSANANAQAPAAAGAAPSNTFADSTRFIMGKEGGYVADDAGKGETNRGINTTANPGIDIKNLTEDGAKEIYKKYWDDIGGDKLDAINPVLAKVAHDTAINMGAGMANQLVKQSGGDPSRLIQLRTEKYQRMIDADPKKWGQYANSWQDRLNSLQGIVDGTPQARSTGYDPMKLVADTLNQSRSEVKPEESTWGAIKRNTGEALDIARDPQGGILPATGKIISSLIPQSSGWVGDTAIDVARAPMALTQTIAGLGNLATGGKLGEALDAIGYNPKAADAMLSDKYSPQRKQAQQNVESAAKQMESGIKAADGAVDTTFAGVIGAGSLIGSLLSNPSVIQEQIIRTLPDMLFGAGVIGKIGKTIFLGAAEQGGIASARVVELMSGAAPANAAELAAIKAGQKAIELAETKLSYLGHAVEGAQATGQNAWQLREDNPNDMAGQYLQIPAGVLTALIGRAASKIPGFGDVQTATQMAIAGPKAANNVLSATGGFSKRVGKGILSEGGFQEFPQSMQEQIWQNIAQGKPWNEGVLNQGVQGGVVGGVMGGVGGGITQPHKAAPPASPLAAAAAVPNSPLSRAALAAGQQFQDLGITQPGDDLAAQQAASEEQDTHGLDFLGQPAQGPASELANKPSGLLDAQGNPIPESTVDGVRNEHSARRIQDIGQQWQDIKPIGDPSIESSEWTPPNPPNDPPGGATTVTQQPADAGFLTPTQGTTDGTQAPQAKQATPQGQEPAAAAGVKPRTQINAPKALAQAGISMPDRKAAVAKLAHSGFETVERRPDGFWLVNSATQEEMRLSGGGDAQLARVAIQAHIQAKADTAAASPNNDRLNPTEGQIEAGNYKKSDVIHLNGMRITLENPAGSTRSGTSPDGKKWETTMAHHYGEFKATEGADGDPLDVFIGPRPDTSKVFVIDQNKADGSFDEHKVMMGFADEASARQGYLDNYEAGWQGLGAMTEMTPAQFKAWAKSDLVKQPVSEYTEQQTNGNQNDTSAGAGGEDRAGLVQTQGHGGRSVAGGDQPASTGHLPGTVPAGGAGQVVTADEAARPALDADSVRRAIANEPIVAALDQNKTGPVSVANPSLAETRALDSLLDAFASITGYRGIAIHNDQNDGLKAGGHFFVSVDRPHMNVAWTIAHEFKHLSEKFPGIKKLYDRLWSMIDSEQGKRDYFEYLRRTHSGITEPYEQMTPKHFELLKDEMIADFMGKRFNDRAWLNKLQAQKPNLFGEFVREWIPLLDQLIVKLRGIAEKMAGVKNVDLYISQLEEAKQIAIDVATAWAEKNPKLAQSTGLDVVAHSSRLESWAQAYVDRSRPASVIDVALRPSTPLRMAGMGSTDKIIARPGFLAHLTNRLRAIEPSLIGKIPQMLVAPRALVVNYEDASGNLQSKPGEGYKKRYNILSDQVDAQGRPYLLALQKMDSGLEVVDLKTLFGRENSLAYVLRSIQNGSFVWAPEKEVDRIKAVTSKEMISSAGKTGAIPGAATQSNQRSTDGIIFSDQSSVKFMSGGDWVSSGIPIAVTRGHIDAAAGVHYSAREQAELQAELDAENAKPEETKVSDAEIKAKGIHAEDAYPALAWKADKGSSGTMQSVLVPNLYVEGKSFRVGMDQNHTGLWNVDLRGTWVGPTMNEPDGAATEQAVKDFTARQVAARDLRERGFDLADSFTKPQQRLLLDGWQAINEMPETKGARRYDRTTANDQSLKAIAAAMGITDNYDVTIVQQSNEATEKVQTIDFRDPETGTDHSAILTANKVNGKWELSVNTSDMGKGGLGAAVYQMVSEYAAKRNMTLKPEGSLSGINTYRRTEQQFSAALRTGKSNVMTPHPTQRLYGFEDNATRVEAHEANLVRMIAASIRNAKELIPGFNGLRYSPEAGVFTDSKGVNQEAKLAKMLQSVDARAFGMGRSTLARAVMSNMMLKGQLKQVESFKEPILYSARETAELEYAAVKAEHEGKPTWMKAPNGKDTLLNERQWIQTRTPSFKRWFGNWELFAKEQGGVWSDDQGAVSRVVDENGEPLVVYHGTDKGGFYKFNQPGGTRRGDLGIFTTSNKDMARSYVHRGNVKEISFAGDPKNQADLESYGYQFTSASLDGQPAQWELTAPDGNFDGVFATQEEAVQSALKNFVMPDESATQAGIYATFINLRNPYETHFEGANWDGSRHGQYKVLDAQGEQLYAADGTGFFTEQEDADKLADEHADATVSPAGGDPHFETTDSAVRGGNQSGDGTIIRQVTDDGGGGGPYSHEPSDVFVAKHSTQLKSADFNSGEFGYSDDIRHSLHDPDFVNPEDRLTVSTTQPTAKPHKKTGYQPSSYAEKRVIDTKDITDSKNYLEKLVAAVRQYNTLSGEGDTAGVLKELHKTIVDNLLWLHDRVQPGVRERAKLWYDGANRIANDWKSKFGLTTDRQAGGILAVFSPQKDWFSNVSLAERALTILTNHQNEAWSDGMTQWANSWLNSSSTTAEKKSRQAHISKMEAIASSGKTLSEMSPTESAYFVRCFDEAYFPRGYRLVTPEGGFDAFVANDDGSMADVNWGGFDTIEKAVSIFRDGSFLNLDKQLGSEHKVRNFYNNIVQPGSGDGHVTIDTHAIAAALLKAVSGNSLEVSHNFGSTTKGVPGAGESASSGASGTYGLVADAYRDAAAQRGLLAREMQSITWEAVRSLFPSNLKDGLSSGVNAIHDRVKSGEITKDQGRSAIEKLAIDAGGDKPFAWEGGGHGVTVADGATSFDAGIAENVQDRQVRTNAPKDARDSMKVSISASTENIPWIKKLYRAAQAGNELAHAQLQQVAFSGLKEALKGTSAAMKYDTVTGLYGGYSEPSLAVTLTFKENDRDVVLAALKQFADNYKQEQIHVRQSTTEQAGTKFPDGSYATPVYKWDLTRAMERKEIQKVIDKSGLYGLTFGDGFVEAYYVGDAHDTQARSGFDTAIARATGLLGSTAKSAGRSVARLWPYGHGDGGIGWGRADSINPAGQEALQQSARLADDSGDRSSSETGGRVPPRYGQGITGSSSSVAYHFSKTARTSLDSNLYGTGLKGLEAERLSGQENSDIRPRSFFYVDKGNGVRAESGVGAYGHHVQLDNLYDVYKDPLGIVKKNPGSNNWERAVLNAGFDGYLANDPVMPQGFAVLLGKQHNAVPVEETQAPGAKANPVMESATSKFDTRTEGSELVRTPAPMELMGIVKNMAAIQAVAPSFHLKYGHAMVLASEASEADLAFAEAGSGFRFGDVQHSAKDPLTEAQQSIFDDGAKRLGAAIQKYHVNPDESWMALDNGRARSAIEKIRDNIEERLLASGISKVRDAHGDRQIDQVHADMWADATAGAIQRSARDLTDTPEFQKFFDGSKVVEADGKPMQMYTGTSKDVDFSSFKLPKNGAWFTNDPQGASEYAKENDSQGFHQDGWKLTPKNTASRVMPVWLSIKNPYTVTPDEMKTLMTATNYKSAQGKIFDKAKSLGYDGVDMSNGGSAKVWVVIGKPSQIKSSIGNDGRFSASNDIRRSARDPLGFYSELSSQVENSSMRQAPAAAWKTFIKALTQKGVKADEIEWTGVNDWLDLQDGKVAKDALLQYLDANGVKVQEVVLGGSDQANTAFQSFRQQMQARYPDAVVRGDLVGALTPEEKAEYNRLADGRRDAKDRESEARYSQYQLPGGTNYREVLLTLPAVKESLANELKSAEKQFMAVQVKMLDVTSGKIKVQAEIDALNSEYEDLESKVNTLSMQMRDAKKDPAYISSHWGQKNVLAHIRLNDRVDADGNKVLFVEELQSDWGQAGKKKGFQDSTQKVDWDGPEYKAARSRATDALNAYNSNNANPARQAELRPEMEAAVAAEQAIAEHNNKVGSMVPAAPFVGKTDAWVGLALKRVIKMAVDGGYDKVAFVSGEQSADRYNLAKVVDYVEYEQTDPGKYYLRVTDHQGGRVMTEYQQTAADLEEKIGKDLAKQIVSGEGSDAGDGNKMIRAKDFKLGGEGMIAFYDKIVPNIAKDVLRKLGGGKLETVQIGQGQYGVQGRSVVDANTGETISTHGSQQAAMRAAAGKDILEQQGFTITDALREKVGFGMPQFSKKDTALDADESVLTEESKQAKIQPANEQGSNGNFYSDLREKLGRNPGGRGNYPGSSIISAILGLERSGVHQRSAEVVNDSGVDGATIIRWRDPKSPFGEYLTTGANPGPAERLVAGDAAELRYSRREIIGQTKRVHTARQLAAFSNVGFQVEVPTLQERAKELWKDAGKKLAQGIVDQFAPIRELSKQAYGLLRLAKGAAGSFETLLKGGMLKLNDGVYDFDETKRGGVVDKLLIPLQGEHHDFLRWIAANRAENLMDESEKTRADGVKLLGEAKALDAKAKALDDQAKQYLQQAGNVPKSMTGNQGAQKANLKQANDLMAEAKRTRKQAAEKRALGNDKKNVSRENLFTREDIAAIKTLQDGDMNADYTLQHGANAGQVTRNRAEAYADSLKTFSEFNKNVMDMAEQSGLIDGEARKMWENEFYVPFYRVSDEANVVGGGGMKGSSVRQQAFKHLKGGTDKLNADLLDNTLMNWAHLLDAGAKNRAAKATLEAAEQAGVAISTTEETARQMGKATSNKQGVVWFMDEGKQHYYLVDDPYVLTAISSLEYAGMRNPMMNAMGAVKNMLTVGVTASPFFKVRNLIRDSIQVIGTGNISYNPVKNVVEGWKLTNPENDVYFRLLAGGGTIHFGTMLEGSEAKRVQALVESGVDAATILGDEHAVKAFYRKFIEPGVTAYNELGNRGEAINRASLYDQLVKQGVSHADASLQARDLMDFSMAGSWTSVRFLTQVVPFLNARIQGLYKIGKAAKEDPKRMAYVTAAIAMASLALLAAYGDDDDWKKREDYDRDNFWWFKFGGTAFRIPKPFELGAIATLAERSAELIFNDEMTGARFRSRVLSLLGDNLSMNPIPQLVKPMLDVYANKNSFSSRPIETMGMERLKADYRFTGNTSMTARAASTAMNTVSGVFGAETLSPVQLDSLIQGYFGWLGTFIVGSADIIARRATNEPTRPEADMWKGATGGMLSKLEDAPSRYVSHVYDQAKAMDEAYATWQALRKEGKTEEAREFREDNADSIKGYRNVEAVKGAIAKINHQIRVVELSERDIESKRIEINRLNALKDKFSRRLAP